MAARFKQPFDERKAAPHRSDVLSMMAQCKAMDDMDDQGILGAIALLLVGGSDTNVIRFQV